MHVVRDKDDGATLLGHLPHLPQALGLELLVTDRQDLIGDEDVRLQVSGHGEGQAQVHARGVAFYGGVQELLHLREPDDVVEAGLDLLLVHAEDGAV